MKRTALVLSGGGAGGAFQIGVLKRIWREEQHNIDAVYGTSVGALNGAGLRYIGFTQLQNIWLGIKGKEDILKLNYHAFLGFAKGKYNTKPLQKLIDLVVDREPLRPSLKVSVTAVNWRNGAVEFFSDTHPNFKKMVLASASVPFHMDPVGDYVDGGVRDHTPIVQAVLDGYERIIVICCNPWRREMQDRNFKLRWPYLVNMGIRASDILQNEVLHGDLLHRYTGIDLIRYAPDERIIDTFEYDPAKIRLAIDQGYRTDASI
jgi:NTE family protein